MGNTGTRAKNNRPGKNSADLELLERVKKEFDRQLHDQTIGMKVGDLVKILEIQKKLSSDEDAREKFWELIEEIRRKELKND